jgi:hypothetical protein
MVPFRRDSLILGAKEVDEVGTIKEHGGLLLALQCEAHLPRWFELLDLFWRWGVEIEIRQMTDIRTMNVILVFRHGNLSIFLQPQPSFLPFAWSL